MTVEMEMGEAFYESFRAALVLTGRMESAERAVADAIAAVGSDLSANTLLVETARSALQHTNRSNESSSVLPLELQALFRLRPTGRHCFILRVLMGFDLELCSAILKLSRPDVEEALCQSLLDLPQAVESIRPKLRIS